MKEQRIEAHGAESAARLALEGVVKRFDAVEAVRGIDLALAPGEFLSLLGPSGCGKSTTLAMIAGFETPTEGAIRVDGRRIDDVPPGRRKIGLVFQDYAVFSRLTVADNLSFGLEAQRVRRAERRRRVAAIAEQLGLSGILDRRGAGLNMSEMQRVALARVLVTEPRLLLLDEPMSNLDAALRASLRSELKLLQKALGQSVLYVTHDQVEAMAMSERIAVMRDGRIEQVGTPDDIYRRPATRFVAEFIGDPPINVIPARVRRGGAETAVEAEGLPAIPLGALAIAEGPCDLAVRPSDIHVAREPIEGGVEAEVRFVENLGVEHVLHCALGSGLVAVTAPPRFAAPGDRLWLGLDPRRLHLIETGTDRIHRAGESA